MKTDHKASYDILYGIYQTHRRKYPENSHDSRQMCLMWSTDDPPDIIEDTPPFVDIEEAFAIFIDDDAALDLYDMHLDEAERKIWKMKTEQSKQSN